MKQNGFKYGDLVRPNPKNLYYIDFGSRISSTILGVDAWQGDILTWFEKDNFGFIIGESHPFGIGLCSMVEILDVCKGREIFVFSSDIEIINRK